MMQKCGNCIWHDDNAVCKNPDALMAGCVMDDLSWCAKYKRKKKADGAVMSELKPCPKYKKDFFRRRCHLVFFTTAEKPPRNIRVSCETHGFTLEGSYESVEEAEAAWNRRAES